jgi:hypothetical protein
VARVAGECRASGRRVLDYRVRGEGFARVSSFR